MKFSATPIKAVYNTENFKVYACDIDTTKFPDIKRNQYGNVTICGVLPELNLDCLYDIDGDEEEGKYGYSYRINYIKQCKEMSEGGLRQFLLGCGLSLLQTDEIVREYPNIISLVINGKSDEIDVAKLHNIGDYRIKVIIRKIEENFMLADVCEALGGYFDFNTIKKLYDRYHSTDEIINKIKETPYASLCEINRIGFKTADTKLLKLEHKIKENLKLGKEVPFEFENDLITSKDRCISAMIYLLDENETLGNTIMKLVDIKKALDKLVPECKHHFMDICKEDSQSEKSRFHIDKNSQSIANYVTYFREKKCSEIILDAVNSNQNVWDIDVEKYRTNGDITLTDEQLKTLDMVCKNSISVLQGNAGCVDCDTEYFNGIEWKVISEYQQGDMVLQYNQDGTAELVKPLRYIKQKSDYLWHFSTKYGLDQCLSDNHICYYITSKHNLYHKTFKEIRENHEKTGFLGKFITTFDYSGKGINLQDDKIKLMIATFADGSFRNAEHCSDRLYNQARFHLKKDRKKARLIEIINACGLKYKIVKSKAEGYSDIYIDVPFRAKHFPKEWYNCNKHQLELIANEVMFWDGDYKRNNRYSTTSKSDADFIQFVYSSLGYRATIRIDDRVGQEYLTNGITYTRKSKAYSVEITKRNLVGMCSDSRQDHKKTPITKYKTKDGYEYCFTVPSHMLVLRRNDRIFITGNCGKSSSTLSLIEMLKDNNKNFELCSPTGKAAKVLANYTHCSAQTIHRLLMYNVSDGFVMNNDNKLLTDIIIVDEISMCDLSLFYALLSAIDFTKTKLLIIGDSSQIPSVGAGNILFDIINSNRVKVNSLSKVFRYGKGGILTVATDVRESKPYLKSDVDKKVFGDDNGYAFIATSQETMLKKVTNLYKQLIDKGYTTDDILVLSAYNKGNYGTVKINNVLQPMINKNYGSDEFFEFKSNIKDEEGIKFYVDDIVIETKNNYKAKLCDESYNVLYDNNFNPQITFIPNGETGRIKKIIGKMVFIQFDKLVCYDYENMKSVKLAYSISTHKSQGSQSKIIILLTPKSHTYMLNSNLLYVAITRASQKVIHFGEVRTINLAIKKKADINRNTNLINFLMADDNATK